MTIDYLLAEKSTCLFQIELRQRILKDHSEKPNLIIACRDDINFFHKHLFEVEALIACCFLGT